MSQLIVNRLECIENYSVNLFVRRNKYSHYSTTLYRYLFKLTAEPVCNEFAGVALLIDLADFVSTCESIGNVAI
jgi:hypothetical protein